MTKYFEKLKSLREEKGFTQEQLANLFEITRQTYASIESGKQNMTLDQAQKVAKFYNISIDSLLTGEFMDINKYKEMIILYLRNSFSRDGRLPKTKLAKLLYLADFSWYYDTLKSMSGMQYRKIKFGPVPDMFFRALSELEEDGRINVLKKENDDGTESILIEEKSENKNQRFNSLTSNEKERIENIAKKWKGKKTNEIVSWTHNQLPYFLCRDNEIIPYNLIIQEDPDKVY